MTIKSKILILSSLAIFVIVFIFWNVYTGPAYSLYKTRKGIENHDYALFEKYNNVDSMINNFIAKMPVNISESNDTLEQLATKLGRSVTFGLKPQMTRIIKKQLKKCIEQGNLDYLFKSSEPKKIQTEKIDKWKNWNSFKFNKINYIYKTGKTAIVGLGLNKEDGSKEYTFRLRMRKTGLHWECVELINFGKR